MAGILWYGAKVVLTSGVLFLYYLLFLRDKTFHHYNRFYLLGASLVSVLLPLLRVKYFTVHVNNENYQLLHQLQRGPAMHDHRMFAWGLFVLSMALVAAFLTGRFIYGIFKILKLKKRYPKEAFEGVRLYMTDLEHAPFSYFKNLFWKHSIPINSGLGRQILEHEMVHIRQRHTYDKIFMEITISVFWFNPFFYLIRREINLIHEYLADKKAIEHSDTKAFAQMLLTSHFSANGLPATSPLLSAHLKKRLTMLKTATTRFSYARKVFVLPLLFTIVFACLVSAQHKQVEITHAAMQPKTTNTGKTTAIAGPDTEPGKSVSKQLTAPKILNRHSSHFANAANEDDSNVAEPPKETVTFEAASNEETRARIEEDARRVKAAAVIARKAADTARQQATIIRQLAEQVKELAKK